MVDVKTLTTGCACGVYIIMLSLSHSRASCDTCICEHHFHISYLLLLSHSGVCYSMTFNAVHRVLQLLFGQDIHTVK